MALERLIQLTRRPRFIAVQEIGNADLCSLTLGAVLAARGYVAFQRHRIDDAGAKSTHDGAALLVRNDVSAQQWHWPEAERWSAHCESASARVTTSDGSFIVTSLYVHGTSDDTVGFDTLLQSLRPDQLLAGDFNAQLQGSCSGVIGQHYAARGRALERVIQEHGAMYPTPTGPTRCKRVVDAAGRKVLQLDDGTINDHIVVGSEVFSRAVSADVDAVVVPVEEWPSDHLPLAWSADIGLRGANNMKWCKRVEWHRVTPEHAAAFNAAVTRMLLQARKERRLDMFSVESALMRAGRSTLPHTRPRNRTDGLFWTDEARRRVALAAQQHGDGAHAELTKSYAAARRETLARNATITPDPTSCWAFVKKFAAFKKEFTLRPGLVVCGADGQPRPAIFDEQERVEALGDTYAAVHANPCGVDAQADLAAVSALLRAQPCEWNVVGVTELQACIATLAPGKCDDFLGLRAEHLRLLTDATISQVLPFVNRCLASSTAPQHWRSALVSAVPKRNRDLTLPKSWRPVSVTAICCRLCETVVQHRVSHVVERPGNRLGQSQFGFRRGVSTALPLSGLSMFIKDGLRQEETFVPWDANDLAQRDSVQQGRNAGGQRLTRTHVTLLVSIDGSDAFCRALPAKAVRKLLDMGCVGEARWIAALLTDRTLVVKDGQYRSSERHLARGVPQGSILGLLLWSLVIDDLIAKCEEKCRAPIPGCIVVPIVFADDINFAVRGFNPSSMVAQANIMMEVVREWATENGVPMAKLQASWITGGNNTAWAQNWTAADGEIVYDAAVDGLHVAPGTAPVKLLGVTFDTRFKFSEHVDAVLATCERSLKMLQMTSSVVKAEKQAILHRGLILSRMLFAVDAWYPFVGDSDRKRLESMHYRACRAVTGCTVGNPEMLSVMYEAGFRTFEETARDETVKTADRLRRMPHGGDLRRPAVCFGPEWVSRLFHDGAMPTARPRPIICGGGARRAENASFLWPVPGDAARRIVDAASLDSGERRLALRDIGIQLDVGHPHEWRRDVRELGERALRPLARVHPFAPHELVHFDAHVRIITDPPGGLTKPKEPVDTWPDELRQRFHDANAARMQELVAANGADCIFAFTDGARMEVSSGTGAERCAGYFAVCVGPEPRKVLADGRPALLRGAPVPAAPIACVYTAEAASIDAALGYVLTRAAALFVPGRPRKLVLVTDSRSTLESVRTTWLRRIDYMEQDVCRKLYALACAKVDVTLAFVFSHVGGAPGNEFVDLRATRACAQMGAEWGRAAPLWYVDTTRRVLLRRHQGVDDAARRQDDAPFRFAKQPGTLRGAPSPPLPRAMSRYHEKLLYRGRVGMLTAAGGTTHGRSDPCPFCGDAAALHRGGGTMQHLESCVASNVSGVTFSLSDMWERPEGAAATLAALSELAQRARPAVSARGRRRDAA